MQLKVHSSSHVLVLLSSMFCCLFSSCWYQDRTNNIKAVLVPVPKLYFNSFVDCNMAEAWIGDSFRIFPGKYGEDPLWGYAHDLKFASGRNADEVFTSKAGAFSEPSMPPNVAPGIPGLHGAVWFETIYQDERDKSGRTLYAVYHNENYPATFPYDSSSGAGYIDKNWPQGLTGAKTPAAVCRIGVMKSADGGRSWSNKGIFIEDRQPRMILKPHNTSVTFAGGVGDPSAVPNDGYLYLFFSEYGYPGVYDSSSYDPHKEWSGQCISVARISLSDLDHPEGKAKRWGGKGFNVSYDGTGKPIAALQVPEQQGGGPVSSPDAKYHWGPSVSWNSYLHSWVMLMAEAEGPSWKGSSIWISYNRNEDLGEGDNSQKWSTPERLLDRPGHILWYPSLQPLGDSVNVANKNTCLRLGREARLFFKDMHGDSSEYVSEYILKFEK